jgi:hypothetical protein
MMKKEEGKLMTDDPCSRRTFLRKFAYISAGALTLSMTSMACYGPAPVNSYATTVLSLDYRDDQKRYYSLSGNQQVPVHLTILIGFNGAMDLRSPVTLTFIDSGNTAVQNSQTWQDNMTLIVTPAANLQNATDYTLRVEDATDSRGAKIQITDTATAVFKTVA